MAPFCVPKESKAYKNMPEKSKTYEKSAPRVYIRTFG